MNNHQLLTIENINNIYNNNLEKYKKLYMSIKHNISGRICHHNVIVLNIIVSYFNITNYLEIGVHNGVSMSYVVRQNKNINCFGIDLFNYSQDWYIRDHLDIQKTYININNNNTGNSNIILISGNSHSPDTINELHNKINDQTIDLLFIDANHSYDSVKKDFDNYTKFLKSGSIIVMDDYNKKWPGVIKFVDCIDTTKYNKIGLFLNNEFILQKI
jgi:predicted O-methyltransferase YrrM